MLSVRNTIASILYIGLLSFVNYTASPEGQWVCATKAWQQDEHTWMQLNCSGVIAFLNTGTIVSSCSDTFTPTGSKWSVSGDDLMLSDSDNKIFARYKWRMPDERTLVLEKNGVTFTFDKVFKPVTAKN